jgi:hypothetical protein
MPYTGTSKYYSNLIDILVILVSLPFHISFMTSIQRLVRRSSITLRRIRVLVKFLWRCSLLECSSYLWDTEMLPGIFPKFQESREANTLRGSGDLEKSPVFYYLWNPTWARDRFTWRECFRSLRVDYSWNWKFNMRCAGDIGVRRAYLWETRLF